MSPATRRDLALLLLVSGLAFWWQLGRLGLIDPDEPFYAQTATEMLERRDLVTPYLFGQPQFEKPPLYYWLACGSFAALGRNEFAARAPGALFATLLVLMTWAFGRAAFGPRAGLLAGIVLATGVAYALVARLMLTDMVFSALVCAACFAFWRAAGGERPRPGWLVIAAAASALATLAKGPLGILVPALAALAWLRLARRPFPARGRALLAAIAVYLAIAGPWYAAMFSSRGMEYFRAFFIHENLDRLLHAEHPANNRPDYYPAVLLLGSWPWIPALALALTRGLRLARGRAAPSGDPRPTVAAYLIGWIATSLAFFTLAQSKLPTYVLFLFAPLALFSGATLDQLLREGFRSGGERALTLGLGALQGLGLLAIFAFREYQGFFAPALVAAACLLVSLALSWRRPTSAWIAATAAGPLALLIGVTGGSANAVEALTSVRPAVAALERAGPPETPVLSSAFLVRGVYYYSHRGGSVLSNRARPFFTPHPLPLVLGPAGLERFVHDHGVTLCVMREKEWRDFRTRGATAGSTVRSRSITVGDKLIVRLEPEDRRSQP